MEFAIQLGGGQVRRNQTGIEAMIEDAELAESLGYDVVYVPDHYVFESLGQLQLDIGSYELFLVLATIAQRTRRIRLGSLVACMLFRHPGMHARLFAQLDEASGGRVIAGVGAGWTRAEFEMFGIEFPDVSTRLAMMDEAILIIRRLWTGEPVSFSGAHYQVTDAVCRPTPVQPGGPPILLGGSGRGILRRAGEWADILHMIPQVGKAGTTTIPEIQKFTDEAVGRKLAFVREVARNTDRPADAIRFSTTIFSYVPTDSPAATRTAADQLAGVFGISADEIMKHPISLIGTPEEMRDEIERRREVHGLGQLTVNFTDGEQTRRFADEVIATLR